MCYNFSRYKNGTYGIGGKNSTNIYFVQIPFFIEEYIGIMLMTIYTKRSPGMYWLYRFTNSVDGMDSMDTHMV